MDNQKQLVDAAAIAQFRFALIAPVVQGLFSDATKTAYYQRVTAEPLTLPDGTKKKYSYKTVEKWYSDYTLGGYDALLPHERADKGTSRVLDDAAIDEIYRIREAYPRLNATQIHKRLVENNFIPAVVSVDSVQRFIKNNDLKGASNPAMKDRKAFEADAFGHIWQADTCYLPYIEEDGKRRRVFCIMIIDDYSRLLVGGELFYNDNAANFQKVFKDAVASYGIPAILYTDHGSSYDNAQLSMICGRIGTVLLHAKVRDGASKGKVERHFRSLKETFIYGLDIDAIRSLRQFNEELRGYIRDYNTRFHTGIGMLPFERYEATRASVRHPQSREWLDENFLNTIIRKVRKDSTVTIDKVSYDVPMEIPHGEKVQILFRPDNLGSAVISRNGKNYPIHPTDKNANCHTRRRNPVLDYSKAV